MSCSRAPVSATTGHPSTSTARRYRLLAVSLRDHIPIFHGSGADIGGSRHTSDVPPSRGQKGNVGEPTRVKKARKGHPGAARALAESPDATRDVYADRCLCGTALEEAGPVDRGE
jgi:hypothetical protein